MKQQRLRLAVAALVGGLAFAGNAGAVKADFVPLLTSVTPSGPNFSYSYNLIFDSVVGAERLESGDFLTIYDFNGIVSATTPAGFTGNVSIQNVGITAPQTAPTDSPTVPNVTFTYTGATLTSDTTFAGALLVSSIGTTRIGDFTSTTTRNTGPQAGTKISTVGPTEVPVPEPASLALLGIGGLGLVVWVRRNRPRV